MLQTIVLIAHVGIALLIIGLVLLQRGKGADAGTGFGAGASGTVAGITVASDAGDSAELPAALVA